VCRPSPAKRLVDCAPGVLGQVVDVPHTPESCRGLLLRHRGRTGWTQRDLTAWAGVRLCSVQDWESGAKVPSAERLQALIRVLLEAATSAALDARAAGRAMAIDQLDGIEPDGGSQGEVHPGNLRVRGVVRASVVAQHRRKDVSPPSQGGGEDALRKCGHLHAQRLMNPRPARVKLDPCRLRPRTSCPSSSTKTDGLDTQFAHIRSHARGDRGQPARRGRGCAAR
jgi:hypothetical protein